MIASILRTVDIDSFLIRFLKQNLQLIEPNVMIQNQHFFHEPISILLNPMTLEILLDLCKVPLQLEQLPLYIRVLHPEHLQELEEILCSQQSVTMLVIDGKHEEVDEFKVRIGCIFDQIAVLPQVKR